MRKFEIFLCLGFLLPLSAHAQHQKIQCWTDEKGNRSCGDQVPPQYAKQERETYNSQGMVIQTAPRQETSDEIAADEKKAHEEKAAQDAATKQAAYDRFLVQTYSSANDIKAARDLRLQAIDGRLNLVRQTVEGNETSLKDLRSRQDSIVEAGRPPDAKLLKQITTLKKSLSDNTDVINSLQAERDHTLASYDRDIARFEQMKGAAPPAANAPPVVPR